MSRDRVHLPLLVGEPMERSDAARNRAAVLEAADRLILRDGLAALTMDAVAQEAGVGKGTVFRRFSSRQGLMRALLDRSEAAWQAEVIFGPPPLGPDADPWDRLLAFGPSRLAATTANLELIRHATVGRHTRNSPAQAFAVMHLRHLLQQLGVSGDLPLLALSLMALFDLDLLDRPAAADGFTAARIEAAWRDLVERIVGR